MNIIARSVLPFLGLARHAEREGWSLVVLDLDLDTTTPVGRFTATVLAGVVELERDLIAAKTRDALAARKAQGVRLGRPVETCVSASGPSGRTVRPTRPSRTV